MKKLFFLGALFAVGLSFTACSDKDVVVEENPSIEDEGGNYIAISINLPTDPATMTRGTDNAGAATLDDGLEGEYAVNDATLIVFKASDQTIINAYNLGADTYSKEGTDDQVTTHGSKIIQMVGNSVHAGDLALVVLNKNSLFTLDGNDIKFDDTKFTGTYAEFQAKTAATTGLDASSMMVVTRNSTTDEVESVSKCFMANAPLADKQGSTTTPPTGANVRVLVPITTVYKTYKEAEDGAADQIYVERGMVKVTMTKGITTSTLANSQVVNPTTPTSPLSLTATIDAWILDNCNSSSYFVRSTDGHSDFIPLKSNASGGVYRYIGNTPITYPSTPAYPYRTYFAKSTNYNTTKSLNRVKAAQAASGSNPAVEATKFLKSFGTNNPQYCFENTFPVSMQTVKNTTLVQLKVTTKTSDDIDETVDDLYTVGGNKTTIYKSGTLTTLLQGYALDYITNNNLIASGQQVTSSNIEVTLSDRDANGAVTVTSLTYATTTDLKSEAYSSGTTLSDAIKSYVNTTAGTILKYEGGVSYYHIRIKHFGDQLTPWNSGEYASDHAPQNYLSTDATAAAKIAKIYPNYPTVGEGETSSQDKNYLGRYGVLRNNWYDLSVKSIN